MVFETHVGETFVLGASSWRVEEITHDRVLVSPAPGEPGKMPFWKGDRAGRPMELGLAIGRLMRDLGGVGRVCTDVDAHECASAAGNVTVRCSSSCPIAMRTSAAELHPAALASSSSCRRRSGRSLTSSLVVESFAIRSR
jgi:hypothetical protein